MNKMLLSTTLALAFTSHAQANEFEPAMRSYLETEIASWASSAVIVNAINAQNIKTSDYDQTAIDAMDTAWRHEVGSGSTPTITPVLTGATADYLRERVEASDGRITEIFVMDAAGLNVAASDVTSDYWQGDEAKFSETYGRGVGSVHFSDVEFDESTQRYQAQISVTIIDPATNQAIGAMTIGVDAEALM